MKGISRIDFHLSDVCSFHLMPRGEGGRDRIREREAKVDLKKGWTVEYEQGDFR